MSSMKTNRALAKNRKRIKKADTSLTDDDISAIIDMPNSAYRELDDSEVRALIKKYRKTIQESEMENTENIAQLVEGKDMIGAKKAITSKLMEKIHELIEADKELVAEEMFGLDEANKTEKIQAKSDKKIDKIKSKNQKRIEKNRDKIANVSAKRRADAKAKAEKLKGKAQIKTDNTMSNVRKAKK